MKVVAKKIMVAPKVKEAVPAVTVSQAPEPEAEHEEGKELVQVALPATAPVKAPAPSIPPLPVGMTPARPRAYDPNMVLPAEYRRFFLVLK